MRIVSRVSLAALLLSLLAAHGPAGAAGIVLDDFEAGVSAWRTNDREAAGERPSEICGIFTVARQIEEGVEQAALIEFQRAEGTWASVSLPIDGTLWARQNVGQVSMLVKGDGSEQTVDLTLRCLLGEERRDVSYVYRLPLESDQWQRRAIRLFAFKDPDGNAPDAEAVRNAYLLQFAKTGDWPALSLRVDEIVAEPIPGAEERPPAEQPLSVRMDFDVDATQAPGLGPVLAQVGVNLGDDLGPVLDAPAPLAAMSRALQQLAPCVVRLKLSDFYDARTGGYDLILLSRAVGWVTEAGAKALVCLTPARLEATDEQPARWDPDFEAAAQKAAALRRGGPHLRYYELFDSPLLRGRFESVEELVSAYNSLAASVLAADPEARVGGPGLASAWDDRIRGFLEGADTLHFLSLKLFGAHNVVATDRELIEAAASGTTSDLPDQLSLAEVRRLARELRRPAPDLFVTEMAMSSAQRPDGIAADERVHRPFGAAWMVTAALSCATDADKLLHYRLFGAGWGLMNRRGARDPLYHAAWLLRTYASRGSTLCELKRPAHDLLLAAVWTPTAHNLFVVYTGGEPRSVVVDAWGIGTPLAVRERRLTSRGELQMTDLPTSSAQSIEFDGPGVCAIQFVSAE